MIKPNKKQQRVIKDICGIGHKPPSYDIALHCLCYYMGHLVGHMIMVKGISEEDAASFGNWLNGHEQADVHDILTLIFGPSKS